MSEEKEPKYGKNKRHSERSAEIWKRENEKKYSDILNMSNKEAAAIIKNAVFNVYGGRGNGKTLSLLAMQSAFAKAIKLLEETPDTATDIVEKEAKNRFLGTHRGLRATTMVADDYAGPYKLDPILENNPDWVKNPEWCKGIQPTYFSLDEFPLTNTHSPEEIQAGLEKKKEEDK